MSEHDSVQTGALLAEVCVSVCHAAGIRPASCAASATCVSPEGLSHILFRLYSVNFSDKSQPVKKLVFVSSVTGSATALPSLFAHAPCI